MCTQLTPQVPARFIFRSVKTFTTGFKFKFVAHNLKNNKQVKINVLQNARMKVNYHNKLAPNHVAF